MSRSIALRNDRNLNQKILHIWSKFADPCLDGQMDTQTDKGNDNNRKPKVVLGKNLRVKRPSCCTRVGSDHKALGCVGGKFFYKIFPENPSEAFGWSAASRYLGHGKVCRFYGIMWEVIIHLCICLLVASKSHRLHQSVITHDFWQQPQIYSNYLNVEHFNNSFQVVPDFPISHFCELRS